MRVSDSMNYNKSTQALSKNREEMSNLQTQGASMKRINRPSDDPVATTKVLTSKTEIQNANQYLKNLESARGFLSASDQALDDLTQLLVRAKELTLSQANDASANEDTRKAVALEIAQIYDSAVQIANRKHNDRFIFGGYLTTKRPFSDQGDYVGDNGQMMIEVNKGTYLPMNVPGSVIFYGEDLAKNETERVSKDVPVNVEMLQQSVQEGRDKFTPEQEINNEEVPVRGPANVRATVVSEYKQEAPPQFGENIFKALTILETNLRTNDKAGVQDSIDRLDKSIDQVVMSRAKVGSRYSQLDSTMQTLYGTNFNHKANISTLEDVDTAELFSELSKSDSALKATMASTAKILQPSLLDFLR